MARSRLIYVALAALAVNVLANPIANAEIEDSNVEVLFGRAAGCNADNCARAVSGTAAGILPALATRRADCISFMAVTVIPAVTTISPTVATVTSTSVSTEQTTTIMTTTTTPQEQKRDLAAATVSASKVPAYASACSGTVRYSSACSCMGITKSTMTAPAVATVTAAQTSTTVTVTTTTQITTETATPAKDCIDVDGGLYVYERIFQGSKKRSDPKTYSGAKPGDPVQRQLAGTLTDCQAIKSCADQGFIYGVNSFDLHFSVSQTAWLCWLYAGLGDVSDFATADEDVRTVYGYNLIDNGNA